MTKKKDPKEPEDQERPTHNSEGREHQVHKEILERRMRGGPKATPDHLGSEFCFAA